MTVKETVKVEVDLPENIYKAADLMCKRFDEEMNELIVYAVELNIRGSIEDQDSFSGEIKELLGVKP